MDQDQGAQPPVSSGDVNQSIANAADAIVSAVTENSDALVDAINKTTEMVAALKKSEEDEAQARLASSANESNADRLLREISAKLDDIISRITGPQQ